MITVPKMTLEDARCILEGAKLHSTEIGVPMAIAVVDDGGHLIVLERMEGAKVTGIQVAMDKAFTAACTRRGTHEYSQVAGPGGSAFGIHVSHQGRFMIFGGGLPVVVNGYTVGGVGCSSGTAEQDREVAQAGIDRLLARLSGQTESGPAGVE